MTNPYLNKAGDVPPAIRIGRRAEAERVLFSVCPPPNGRPQCVAIQGGRWIGKTTLLKAVHEQCKTRSAATVAIHMPLHGYACKAPQSFFLDLLNGLRESGQEVRKEWIENPNTNALKKVCEAINAAGRTFILMLDDFEVVASNPNFSLELFGFLRWLPEKYRIAYVTATRRPLWEPFIEREDIRGSPFPNIFQNPLSLAPFTAEDFRDMISVSAKVAGVSLNEEEGHLQRLAGRFPLFLQIACHLMFDLKVNGHPLGEKDLKLFHVQYQEIMNPYLETIWAMDFTDEDRRACASVLDKKRVPEESLSRLQTLEYAECEGERPQLVPQVFRDFVVKKLSRD